ncbi:MAG: site-specific DNA-methyltransferase [bacterium]|jgi:adenine-specific DNA-methyltransferase
MDKMRFESPDMTTANIDKIAALFPNVVSEARGEDGKLKHAVNFDMLRQILSDDVIEGDEAYEFTWVGKKAAMVEAGRPIRKTLRPSVEESKNWDTTENLYIEGDNLDVLKLLQESYLGKVKMIYIDPPYNTGNDFVYQDNFAMSREIYDGEAGVYNEEGDRLFRNTESNGRFHSDWCSMMYPRLVLARNLLSENGAIFISIDDNELYNLKKICDEVFGTVNYFGFVYMEKTHRV